MYKVLLADDEILDLEGMKRFIPWESLGMTVVESVTNGFAAFEVLKSRPVDILVSDIRMPNMTGLELARHAIQSNENIQIIFVSGYQDFGYVKQAMALNACSYVLKPMDDRELIEALEKVRRKLDSQRVVRETEHAYRQMIPMVKHQYLQQLLENPYTAVPMEVLNREYHLDEMTWPAFVAILELDDKLGDELDDVTVIHQVYADKEEGTQELIEAFNTRLHSLLEEQGLHHFCKIGRRRTAVILDAGEGRSAVTLVLTQLKREFPFTITVGAGNPVGVLEELHPSYSQAVAALDYKMFRGKDQWIRYSEIPSGERKDAEKLDISLDMLLAAMTRYDLVSIHDELEAMRDLAGSMRSRFAIRNFAMYVMVKLEDYLHTMHEDLFHLLGMEFRNLDVLLQFETMDDIFSWLRRRVFELSELLQNRKGSKNGRLIQEIIEDVQSRLHQNVTLRDVANRFSFSPNYLGSLFKEETGQNFSDFVIALRMERAKELLGSTKLKIYEVAAQTGYQYLPYFSRQFKEACGMTPLEYRRTHG